MDNDNYYKIEISFSNTDNEKAQVNENGDLNMLELIKAYIILQDKAKKLKEYFIEAVTEKEKRSSEKVAEELFNDLLEKLVCSC